MSKAASTLREVNLSWLTADPNGTQPELAMVETASQRGFDGKCGTAYRRVMAPAAESFWTVILAEVVVESSKCLVLNWRNSTSILKWFPVEFLRKRQF